MQQDTAGTDTTVGSLASIVAVSGPLAFADVLGLGADVAGNLAQRHLTGEAHGGVQPRSIVRDGEGIWVLANPLAINGSAPATAPELDADPTPSPPADVYALGASLVYGLTGQEFEHGTLGAGPDTVATGVDDGGPPTAAMAMGPRSLPEVMDHFLSTLRLTLASDPAQRPSAGDLAATMRELWADAERALVGTAAAPPTRANRALPVAAAGGMAAGAVVLTPDAALADYGTAGTAAVPTVVAVPPKSFADRLPLLVACAAVVMCLILGVALLRKSDRPAGDLIAGGVGTSTTAFTTTTEAVVVLAPPGTETTVTTIATTTTKPVTTTTKAPPITVPPTTPAPTTTIPAGTALVTVDMTRMTSCPGCLASLRAKPALASAITAQFPHKTELFGQCVTNGESAHDDQGSTSVQWIYVVGPIAQGWIPVHLVGRQTYGLAPCPQEATTTVAPPTTTAATTTTSTSSSTTTTTTTP